HPRRAPRRRDPVHTTRRGRRAVGFRRSDHQRLGRGARRASAVRGRHLGSGRGGEPHRTGRTRVAQGVVVDTMFWGARQGGVAAHGDFEDRLASAVIPLLVPDLPVFLWWTGTPPLGSRSFGDLLRLTDRLVVDSADFARPELTLPIIARISEAARGRFGLTDL